MLSVIYLIFNEGYSASSGDSPVRGDLCDEATRLARIIAQFLPKEAEVKGLLALMLLHDSRWRTRLDSEGSIIPLEHQNRRRWDKGKIEQGKRLLHETLPQRAIGPYQIQAAISTVHAESPSWEETDWPQIQALYALLYQLNPTPVIGLNQAIALSYARSAGAGLAMLDEVAVDGALADYQPYYAAKADLLTRCGDKSEALDCLQRAVDLSDNKADRHFLQAKAEWLRD